MQMTVLVPTYCRPEDLERCLGALQRQQRPPDEVIVTVRDRDPATWAFFKTFDPAGLPLRLVTVTVPGVVAALNVGLEASQGDLISITDDDAAPHPDWLERIEAYFVADRSIAGVGGRDWVYHGTWLEDGSRLVVGQVQWFGRVIGNHHIGVGAGQPVDVLKGVNMSFRRSALKGLQFDSRLHGTGAQVHFEIAVCLALRRSGWTLIYDSQIAVDHFRGQRFDEDQRDQVNSIAIQNAVHNETLILLEHFPLWQKAVFLLWAMWVGTRDAVGLVQWLRFFPSQGRVATQKLQACWQGRWQGWQTWRTWQQARSRSALAVEPQNQP